MSAVADLLAQQLDEAGIQYVREFRFDAARRWRLDFALLGQKAQLFAVEVEGGTWSGGRHVRGKGFAEDCAKYNAAGLHGWTVLRVTSEMVRNGAALRLVEKALEVQREARQEADVLQEENAHLRELYGHGTMPGLSDTSVEENHDGTVVDDDASRS